MSARQPSLFIPHGGGPWPWVSQMRPAFAGLEAYLSDLPGSLPEPPRAILVVSGHWEEDAFTFTGTAPAQDLEYDYYGFPPETYHIRWPAPGAPELVAEAEKLIAAAGLPAALDPSRRLDHGVFVPLAVAWPEANVPLAQMSLHRSFDPALHIAAGRALAPLRDEGVLILGSGMSFHNLRAYGNPAASAPAAEFDRWLTGAATVPGGERAKLLAEWTEAPHARFCHPRPEHLLPLMVAAGASDAAGTHDFGEEIMAAAISGYRFA